MLPDDAHTLSVQHAVSVLQCIIISNGYPRSKHEGEMSTMDNTCITETIVTAPAFLVCDVFSNNGYFE